MSSSSNLESADLLRKQNFELDRHIHLLAVPSECLNTIAVGAHRCPSEILESMAVFAREAAAQIYAWKDGVQPPPIAVPGYLTPPSRAQREPFDRLLALYDEVSQSFAELVHALSCLSDRDLTTASPGFTFSDRMLPRAADAPRSAASLAGVTLTRLGNVPAGTSGTDQAAVQAATGAPAVVGVERVAPAPDDGRGQYRDSGQYRATKVFGSVLERDVLGRKRAYLSELVEMLVQLEAQGFSRPSS